MAWVERSTAPRLGALIASLAALWPGTLAAAPCGVRYSSCIDANALWPQPGGLRFFSIASPEPASPRQISFAALSQALIRPLTLEVPAPSDGPREVRLVDHAVDMAVLLEAGAGHGISIGVAAGMALFQRGSGAAGITSQRGDPLTSSAPRDPRITVSYSRALGSALALEPRFELSVPLGDEQAYAGGGAPTAAPAVAFEARFAAFRIGVDLGLRLRRSVELGTGRWGSQGSLALGISAELVGHGRLFASAELFALPALTGSTSERAGELGVESTWIPAEWLLSLGARPEAGAPWTIVVGAGAGIPASYESSPAGERVHVGPTSPAFRGLLALRYAVGEPPTALRTSARGRRFDRPAAAGSLPRALR